MAVGSSHRALRSSTWAWWPPGRTDEALEALARRGRLLSRMGVGAPGGRPGGERLDSLAGIGTWIEGHATRLGLEAEPADVAYGEVERLVRGAGPALLTLRIEGAIGVLALVGASRGHVRLLAPDLRVRRVPLATMAGWLRDELETSALPEVDRLLASVGIASKGRRGARAGLAAERLRAVRIGGCWLLRLPPGASFWAQARASRLPYLFSRFAVTYAISYAMLLASWWVLGLGALNGRLVGAWLAAWGLILACLLPARAVSVWSRARAAIGLGALLKRRLLHGALSLRPDEIRHQGAGQLLGRVLESEAVESLALHGGFLAVVAVIELVFALAVLGAGAGGAFHLGLGLVWLIVAAGLGWSFYRVRAGWTGHRIAMTHDLIERVVGHRTRLAQEPRELWHREEDGYLETYQLLSRGLDRRKAWLLAVIPRGWLVVGFLAVMPAFVAGGSRVSLAIALGGILAAFRGFSKLAEGFNHLSGALVAWGEAKGLFRAAARQEPLGALAARAAGPNRDRPTDSSADLEVLNVGFRHEGRGRAALRGCSLTIHPGDRLLVEGPSGGGKSTLAAVLSGLRVPETGLVLHGGLDLATVGAAGWRRRVVAAPQFHENHVVTETFGFNLLLGRGWPPTPGDLAEAEEICRELGLDDLLARMPAGLQQLVGETGWQLSHGERSRLYVARALLQRGDVVILDESFAALDPDSLDLVLTCVFRRAPTLLVIAHP